jgi:hypothetical protein
MLTADLIAPAIAPHHATDTVLFNRLPAGVIAERTRHHAEL